LFVLDATLSGHEPESSEHESLAAAGKALSAALNKFGRHLPDRAMCTLLALVAHDLDEHLSWTWASADVYIRIARTGNWPR
jgi:hypothetical protein